MKTKIYIYAAMAFGMSLLTGCEDLDTFPEGSTQTTEQIAEVVESLPQQSEATVNAIFATFTQFMPNEDALGASRHNDFGYGSVMMFLDHNGYDMISEDNGYNWNGNNMEYSDRVFTSNECQILWNDMYSIIKASNSVVGIIDPETTEPTSQYYLAQGLASRAFSYWVLAQVYQFNYVGNESQPCVPLITDANLDDAAANGIGRSTVEEVYTQIESDLDAAIIALTGAQEGGIIRGDKRYIDLAVAYGLRARVNLTKQNWTEAAADATSAIAVSSATPSDLSTASRPAFWTENETNWMWGILIAETDDVVTSGIVNWISHMGSINWGYANYSGGKQINKILFESIPTTDVRKGWWIDENLASDNLTAEELESMSSYAPYTQAKFAAYQNVVQTATNANDIPLMRIEEMYLIKAEAEAMSTGSKSTLESFVQTYRNPNYTCSATTSEEIQEEVFNQRRIELWGEGMNWFDIMRLNKDVDRRGAGFPNATMVFNIEAGSDILLWRIPEAEIQANQGLTIDDNNPVASAPDPVTDFE